MAAGHQSCQNASVLPSPQQTAAVLHKRESDAREQREVRAADVGCWHELIGDPGWTAALDLFLQVLFDKDIERCFTAGLVPPIRCSSAAIQVAEKPTKLCLKCGSESDSSRANEPFLVLDSKADRDTEHGNAGITNASFVVGVKVKQPHCRFVLIEDPTEQFPGV